MRPCGRSGRAASLRALSAARAFSASREPPHHASSSLSGELVLESFVLCVEGGVLCLEGRVLCLDVPAV